MKTICTILFTIALCLLTYSLFSIFTDNVKDNVQKLCEKAYFEGQKDAINGDFRIKMNKDSCYYWTKSPWDEKTKPIYFPTYLESNE